MNGVAAVKTEDNNGHGQNGQEPSASAGHADNVAVGAVAAEDKVVAKGTVAAVRSAKDTDSEKDANAAAKKIAAADDDDEDTPLAALASKQATKDSSAKAASKLSLQKGVKRPADAAASVAERDAGEAKKPKKEGDKAAAGAKKVNAEAENGDVPDKLKATASSKTAKGSAPVDPSAAAAKADAGSDSEDGKPISQLTTKAKPAAPPAKGKDDAKSKPKDKEKAKAASSSKPGRPPSKDAKAGGSKASAKEGKGSKSSASAKLGVNNKSLKGKRKANGSSGSEKKAGSASQGGKGDKKAKWTTLEHNGVLFPPDYKPHGVKILYDGQPVDLTPEQEEVATFYAVMRETDYIQKPVFRANFWKGFSSVLGPKHVIKSLEKCDFTPIWEYHLREKEKKKEMTKEEKAAIKEEKLKAEEKYAYAIVDGNREKMANFRVEPPGLFRGRGEHPKMGMLKARVYPEDVTINIGPGAPVPECTMPGHKWKEVRRDNTVTWLAFWKDPINGRELKYVWLAASSSIKGQSDREKYDKARVLTNYIEKIRNTYNQNLGPSVDVEKRQLAVATYLIDRLALRAGNEKEDDEAETVGCCSLKVCNVELEPPSSVTFDFLGKDSIRYFNTVNVEPAVFAAIQDFKKGKEGKDDLFHKLDTGKLNNYLKTFGMDGLTAKVFRTYNASITLDSQLADMKTSTLDEKLAEYHRANKMVAILCNHQRAAPKQHENQMALLKEKLAALQEEKDALDKEIKAAKAGANTEW
eukprot:jgi/Mesvir1/16904/Mv15773-RA.2